MDVHNRRALRLKRPLDKPGKIRIIGGRWRGTRLAVPDLAQLRPTPARVRETAFNWLRNHIAGSVCLDLYAGTGALGFEAASRGAARVVLVEQNRDQAAALRRQAETLRTDIIEVVQADALIWLASAGRCFDLVFLDPPFAAGLLEQSLALLQPKAVLRPGGLVYVEAEAGLTITTPGMQIIKHGSAGQVQYMLLAQNQENQ